MWKTLSKYHDAGLLLLRVTLGTFFIYMHGWPKLAGGVARWRELGRATRHIGISFAPEFWGFMAAFAESVGCALFVLGLAFRPASALVAATLIMASIMMYSTKGLSAAAHPIELAIVFFCFIFIGPGKFSFDKG